MELKDKFLIASLILLCTLFIIGLFKNIGYPLLWMDEAETAMFANRILEYGYPKVHDDEGKHNLILNPKEYNTKKDTDIYISTVWGHYYFSTIGAFFAKIFDDIYTKTAVLRIPFAIIGLAGLAIMAVMLFRCCEKDITTRLLFLNLFTFFLLLSVPLLLHLRQVRYYPIIIFLSACIIYAYVSYRVFGKMRLFTYIIIMGVLLLLIFNTFPPLYFIFAITLVLFELLEALQKKEMKNFLQGILPVFVSFVPVYFLLNFFEIPYVRNEYIKLYNITPYTYWRHLIGISSFLQRCGFLHLVLAVKFLLVFLWFYLRRRLNQKLQISNFLSLFFIIGVYIASRIPHTVLFQRYYILLVPILIMILLLDLAIIIELAACIEGPLFKRRTVQAVLFMIVFAFAPAGLDNKVECMKGYLYELTHQYKGCLDFVIPYIKSKYKNPEDLIIATNYEDFAYMYYLGSKVLIGHAGYDIEEALKMKPDIIIVRKQWRCWYDSRIFNIFLQKGDYKKVSFPVFDYPVNNIPELGRGVIPHLFKTKMAMNEDTALDIYIKE